MTPAELADRIESLDWSGTSLQHQLAMSAAVVTLRDGQVPALDNPVGEMQALLTDLLRVRQVGPNKLRDAAF